MVSDVTVLIRTYNSQETIDRALQSVLNQTMSQDRFQVLVVDDGSDDNSVDIVERYSRPILLKCNHMGSIAALNSGLRRVETPFVIMLDSDDWFEPTILETMHQICFECENIDFVYSDYYEIRGSSREIVTVADNIFNTVAAGIMFSMDMLRSAGYYDESLIFPEYDLLIRTRPYTIGYYIPEPLYNYHRRSESITSDESLVMAGKRELEKKYGNQYPIRDY